MSRLIAKFSQYSVVVMLVSTCMLNPAYGTLFDQKNQMIFKLIPL